QRHDADARDAVDDLLIGNVGVLALPGAARREHYLARVVAGLRRRIDLQNEAKGVSRTGRRGDLVDLHALALSLEIRLVGARQLGLDFRPRAFETRRLVRLDL